MPFRPHFGLNDYPFQLSPNPDYFFPGSEHLQILSALEFALGREAGIVKVTGEIGTGKTLLCHLLLRKMGERENVAYLHAPQAAELAVIHSVCHEFGLFPDEHQNPYEVLRDFLLDQYAQGRMAILVVDEAQALGRDGLEAIRLLSTLEAERNKLLQIVLFGQTELDEMLKAHSLRQLNQRIVFSFTTKPLSMQESRRYVLHRLRLVRVEGVQSEVFSRPALGLLVRAARGIPRAINVLADKSLLSAFSEGAAKVGTAHVREAIRDSRPLLNAARPPVARAAVRVAAVLAGAAAAAALLIGASLAGGPILEQVVHPLRAYLQQDEMPRAPAMAGVAAEATEPEAVREVVANDVPPVPEFVDPPMPRRLN